MSKDIEISLNSILKIPVTLIKCLGISIITMFFAFMAFLMFMIVRESIRVTTGSAFWGMTWYLTKWALVIAAVVTFIGLMNLVWDKDYKIKIPLSRKVKLPKATVYK